MDLCLGEQKTKLAGCMVMTKTKTRFPKGDHGGNRIEALQGQPVGPDLDAGGCSQAASCTVAPSPLLSALPPKQQLHRISCIPAPLHRPWVRGLLPKMAPL